jgi:hypothetical protein
MATVKIIGAAWGAVGGKCGAAGCATDVTQLVRQKVQSSIFKFTADDSTFGDPNYGEKKHFGVVYQVNDEIWAFACEEGQTVILRSQ